MQLIPCLLSSFYLNMFWASLCPSSGEQDCVLLLMVFCTGCAGCGCVELGHKLCALCEGYCSTLIKQENIVNYVKAQRLSWFGHIQRMPEARAAKKIFKWNPLTTRPSGRPKYRWEDNIIQELGQMKIKNWLTCVQDRAKWKDVVEKAKTSN